MNSPSSKTNTKTKPTTTNRNKNKTKHSIGAKMPKGFKGNFSKQGLGRIVNNWASSVEYKTYYTQCYLTLLYSCSFFVQCSSFLIQDCTFLVHQILLQGMLHHQSGSVDTRKIWQFTVNYCSNYNIVSAILSPKVPHWFRGKLSSALLKNWSYGLLRKIKRGWLGGGESELKMNTK